jgi:hypothetical protein
MHLGPGGDNRLVLNGEDITALLNAITLTQGNTGDAPRLTLDLHCPTVDAAGDMDVQISAATRQLLARLGWTPPRGCTR